jgi:hypothetical protein
MEALWVRSVPDFHGIHGGFAVEHGLGQVFVVEQTIAKQGLFEVFATPEMMSLQDVRDTSIETLDPASGLRRPGAGQAMFDVQRRAQLIEFMLAAGLLVAIKEPIGEFLAVVCQNFLEANRAGAGEVLQESPGAPGTLVFLDLQINPAGRPVDGDEENNAASSRLPSAADTSRPHGDIPARTP